MPITTDAVAISKKAVNEFIESDEYRKCKKADLIFAEFLSDDGELVLDKKGVSIVSVKSK